MKQTISNGVVGTAKTLAIFVALSFASHAWATVGPPVKIVIPLDKLQPATSGQEYAGTIVIKVSADGQLDNFELSGEGWRVNLVDSTVPVDVQAGTSHTVQFRGTPIDAEKPLVFEATFDGRPISKRINLGPKFFENAGKPGRVASLDSLGRVKPFRAADLQTSSNNTAGESYHFFGRIVYQRPTSTSNPTLITVGADYMWFEINDDDSPDPFDDHIYRGYTDINGYFDVNVSWDDCDIGCDDPDIYIRWETDNYIVAVQAASILEEDYSWSTEDDTWDDFEGSEINFGTLMAGDPSQHPAVHIHNSIVRAWRYIHDNAATDVDRVEVLWPQDGSNAYYSPDTEEISISAARQWNEGTHTHEYGHHFLEIFSVNTEPDYCNGVCDTYPEELLINCGHCADCSETDHDAWNEGWPNWLADVVTRSYPLGYTFLDGTPYEALVRRSQESAVQALCSRTGMPNDPLTTESYAGALVRDIEDNNNSFFCSVSTNFECTNNPGACPCTNNPDPVVCPAAETCNWKDDDHNGGSFNCNALPLDCTRDTLALGVDEIFTVVRYDQPTTPLEFVQAFRNRYPQYVQDLWSTVTNVAPAFSFVPPTPEILTQSPECKMNIAGQSLSLDVQGNGSALRYQWERYNVDVNNDTAISGAQCSTLTFNPLTAAHEGIYRAEVFTCDQSSSTMSQPIRVSVFPARGEGNLTYAWGRNDLGQLGLGTTAQALAAPPAEIPDFADVVAVSAGNWHSLALKSDGTVVAWGMNQWGELGTGTVGGLSMSPVPVVTLTDIVAISAGNGSSMALKVDGSVWVWGYDWATSWGGSPPGFSIPAQVPGLSCVTAIALGRNSYFAVRSDGSVWAWGWSSYGELGPQVPINTGRATPVEVTGINDATTIAVGSNHVLARRADGTLLAWGYNNYGTLGNGGQADSNIPAIVPGVSNVVSIGAGPYNSVAIVAGGTAWGWGTNHYNQLCSVGGGVRYTPVPINGLTSLRAMDGGAYHNIFMHDDGTITTCGYNYYGVIGPLPQLATPVPYSLPGISGANAIAAGEWTSFALPNGIAPSIRFHPRSLTVLAGQPAVFSVEAVGLAPLSYQWSRDGIDIVDGGSMSGANASMLIVNPAFGTLVGSYSVQIANASGIVESIPVTLTVSCPNGDGNCDGIIDPVDVANLAQCLNGPGRPRPPACEVAAFGNFDANNDNDVDLRDAAVVQNCFAGDEFIDPACGQP